MKRNSHRTTEDILASGIARLSLEAPRIVPVGYVCLFKNAKAGRLKTFGSPLSVDISHLQSQYRKGFPLVEEQDSPA